MPTRDWEDRPEPGCKRTWSISCRMIEPTDTAARRPIDPNPETGAMRKGVSTDLWAATIAAAANPSGIEHRTNSSGCGSRKRRQGWTGENPEATGSAPNWKRIDGWVVTNEID